MAGRPEVSTTRIGDDGRRSERRALSLVDQVSLEIWDLSGLNLLTPLLERMTTPEGRISTGLPEALAEIEILEHRFPLPEFEQFLSQYHAWTEGVELWRTRRLACPVQMADGWAEMIPLKLHPAQDDVCMVDGIAVEPIAAVPLRERQKFTGKGLSVVQVGSPQCSLRGGTKPEKSWIGKASGGPEDVHTETQRVGNPASEFDAEVI